MRSLWQYCRHRLVTTVLPVLLSTVLLPQSIDASAPVYTRTLELRPVTLTQAELFSAISRIRTIIASANADSSHVSPEELVSISTPSSQLQLADKFQLSDLVAAPAVAYDVTYSYHRRDSAISRVSIRLNHHWRTVMIEGTSTPEIDALASLVATDLTKHYRVGGFGWTIAAVFLIVAVSIAVAFWSIRWESRLMRAVALVMTPLLAISTWFLPMERLLPGFVLLAGSASFIERHAPEISFLGLLASMVPLAINAFRRSGSSRGRPHEQSS